MGSITPRDGGPANNKLQIKIRPARETDMPKIASLGSKTFTATFAHSMPATDLKEYLESVYSHTAMENEFSNPSIDIYVAYDEVNPQHIMGFVELTQGTTDPCLEGVEAAIELQRLYVDERYHGKGVGGALTKHVEKTAKEMGFATIWLGVWEENLNAHKAYERFGFKKIGEHDFVIGKCIQTDWVLMKPL
jgi:ribosomal protein S18 acetylase RimI-like enzyme